MYTPVQRQLLAEFADVSDKLLDLNIIRTDSFLGEIAEYYACKAYQLSLVAKVTAGHDARCAENNRYQVKSKIVTSQNYRYSLDCKSPCGFDFLIVLWYNEDLIPKKISKIKVRSDEIYKINVNLATLGSQHSSIDIEDIKIPAVHKKEIYHFLSIFRNLQITGIIRSKRIVGDIGEYYACKKLHLTIAANKNQKGYDATGPDGNTYEIKCRRIYESQRRQSESRRLNGLKGKSAKFLVVVALDREFTCSGMWVMPFKNITQLGNAHMQIVNDTPGVVTVVKSRISWLKDSPKVHASIPKSDSPKKTRPLPDDTPSGVEKPSLQAIVSTNQTSPSRQDGSVGKTSSEAPLWIVIMVIIVLFLLYLSIRLT